MLQKTSPSVGRISQDAPIALVPYYPMPGAYSIMRATWARNPAIRQTTAAEVDDVAVQGGVGVVSQTARDFPSMASAISRYLSSLALRGVDPNLQKQYLAQQLASGSMMNVPTALSTAIMREYMFGVVALNPARNLVPMRRVWGGLGVANPFAPWPSGATGAQSLAASIGAPPGYNYLPWISQAADAAAATWFARLILAIEFPAYLGMAAKGHYDHNKYLDPIGAEILSGSAIRAALAAQLPLAFIQCAYAIYQEPEVRMELKARDQAADLRFERNIEALARLPLSPLAWSVVGGSSEAEVRGFKRKVYMWPGGFPSALIGVFGSPLFLQAVEELADAFRGGELLTAYTRVATLGGWRPASPWIDLPKLIDLDDINPHYTDGLRLDSPPSKTPDVRALPYLHVRHAVTDSTYSSMMGTKPDWDRALIAANVANQRVVQPEWVVDDSNPSLQAPSLAFVSLLRAIRPLPTWTGEDWGVNLGGRKVAAHLISLGDVSSVAAAMQIPSAEVDAAIRSGQIPHLYATGNPKAPVSEWGYISERTLKSAVGATYSVATARPRTIACYSDHRGLPMDQNGPVDILSDATYRIDGALPPALAARSAPEVRELVDPGVHLVTGGELAVGAYYQILDHSGVRRIEPSNTSGVVAAAQGGEQPPAASSESRIRVEKDPRR